MSLDFPTIFLLSTHLAADELHDLEEQIPTLTYDVGEAEVVLGKITRKERALFELRRLHLVTEEAPGTEAFEEPPTKRRRLGADSARGDEDGDGTPEVSSVRASSSSTCPSAPAPRIKVARLSWFTDSVAQGEVLPLDKYLVYEGVVKEDDPETTVEIRNKPDPSEILRRAQLDALNAPPPDNKFSRWSTKTRRMPRLVFKPPVRPALVRTTTSEHEATAQLPPIPDYLHSQYSCQRPTPTNPPNNDFIEELKKIRKTRQLTGDKVGIRAYSSAIASLAAYPYSIIAEEEVSRLPGCGPKIAELYKEFRQNGVIQEVLDAEADPKLKVLSLFYEVWGCAEVTAREWYNKGWRDLDDVVQYGWDKLSKVQQIGVKFYDELLLKIPRSEVEHIANVVLDHANRLRPGFQQVIVGGYRRGKQESGDVDLVISNPDESATNGFIPLLVDSLQSDGYIPYTLSLSTKNSERGQVPVSWKGNASKGLGSGFDTLDKAMVVWQEPDKDPSSRAAGSKKRKNPNPHRRVDIIVSPWKTAGCAVLGWTSGITFQRDLRRYCRHELALKFDSSGIRSRADGSWVDLEGGDLGKAPDMLTAEKRVFAGLKLEWRPPEERSTG